MESLRSVFFYKIDLPGGDKPRRYFLACASGLGAGFIPARNGLNVESSRRTVSIESAGRTPET
jgi:hypothetical protein